MIVLLEIDDLSIIEKYKNIDDTVFFILFNKKRYDEWRYDKHNQEEDTFALRQKWADHEYAKAIGQGLKRLDKNVEHKCSICGKTFIGISKAKYCSGACRAKSYRINKLKKENNL
ncbi:Uncharacterised protein [Campylobacter hyointestinalis subsp. hyointestinalis]|uniref:Uncharacterized protein n=1 Tax=Campylobacter hyointestinalis subsp. hyointestinalis TaxID=91352 RepID=A0A9W5EY00_CAMHY|nr:hypothetical protein [Campylobacter hyointestinalis]CUU79387.1 Uncharacterised protein [Campylobacter hyointestinalis subsp. hyointestinalis]